MATIEDSWQAETVERGELPPGSDPNLIVETLIDPIWVRLLLTGEPIDDDLADRVTLLVMNGASSTCD